MQFFRIFPARLWVTGIVVILLVLAAYQTFIGDRRGVNIETSSPKPMPSYEYSPPPSSAPTASSSPAASTKASLKPSASVAASASPSPSPSGSAASSASPSPSASAVSNQPTITGVSPAPAPGISVTFSGSAFGTNTGAVTFYEGGTPAGTCNVTAWSETSLTCTMPNLTAEKNYGMQLTTSDGRQSSFKYYTL